MAGQTVEEYSVTMELDAPERDWDLDVGQWDRYRIEDYIKWVKETYGLKAAKKLFAHAKQYRAIMDVKQSVKEERTQSISEMLGQAMVDTKDRMAAAMLHNVFNEEYEKWKKDGTTGKALTED